MGALGYNWKKLINTEECPNHTITGLPESLQHDSLESDL
jgi:hypothetical protein